MSEKRTEPHFNMLLLFLLRIILKVLVFGPTNDQPCLVLV